MLSCPPTRLTALASVAVMVAGDVGLGVALADASAAALSIRLWAKLGEAVVGDRGSALGEEEALLGLAAVGVDGPFFGSGGGAIRGIAPNEVKPEQLDPVRAETQGKLRLV